MFERGDRGRGIDAGINQIFGQGADDAIAPRIDLANFTRVFARGFQDATSRGVDHGGDTARLGIKSIFWGITTP